jgi:3-keto-5-aminohexanoate cleavage enzyme
VRRSGNGPVSNDTAVNCLSIMVALNGARKTKQDHPWIPLSAEEIANEAAACAVAGVQAVHLHVRDDFGEHSLDPARYLSTIAAIRKIAGTELIVQITTESAGRFSPSDQIETVRAVCPEAVSIAIKELVPDYESETSAAALYLWAFVNQIAVQHIIYGVAEFERLLDLVERKVVPGARHSVIFPLGRYDKNQESDPVELVPLVNMVLNNGGSNRFDWSVCAFGASETEALVTAAALGGHCRIGFENSFLNADGSIAKRNAERVADLKRALYANRRPRASRAESLRMLGRPV